MGNRDIFIYLNHELAANASRLRISLDDLVSCQMPPEYQSLLQSSIVYLNELSAFTYEFEKESFGCYYDDSVANEWSNNMTHFYSGSRRNDIIIGFAFSIQLADKLMDIDKDFRVMMLYGKERIDSVKVSFYIYRENIPDIVNLSKLNDVGVGRLMIISRERLR